MITSTCILERGLGDKGLDLDLSPATDGVEVKAVRVRRVDGSYRLFDFGKEVGVGLDEFGIG